jgi:hypothetical protein
VSPYPSVTPSPKMRCARSSRFVGKRSPPLNDGTQGFRSLGPPVDGGQEQNEHGGHADEEGHACRAHNVQGSVAGMKLGCERLLRSGQQGEEAARRIAERVKVRKDVQDTPPSRGRRRR